MMTITIYIYPERSLTAQRYDDPWEFAGTDNSDCLNEDDFTRLWQVFDANDDGNVTHLEFDSAYNRLHFEHRDQEDRFFMELDRVPMKYLNDADFAHIFHFFDINNDGTVTHLEFDTAYTRFDFDNKDQEDLFFLELDRVPDEALTSADFQHIFKLFDIDDLNE
nr:hypothetical protein BaRGS_010702 [Batillaria attramentaria]